MPVEKYIETTLLSCPELMKGGCSAVYRFFENLCDVRRGSCVGDTFYIAHMILAGPVPTVAPRPPSTTLANEDGRKPGSC